MRFYTKEWYKLMQHQDDTMCMNRTPDKDYFDKEIKVLFEKNAKRRLHAIVGSITARRFSWICPIS